MDDKEYLNLYPFRATGHEEKDGLTTVLYVNPNPNFFERIFFKKASKRPFKIDLDDIGSFIWSQCDGKSTVGQIIEKGKEKFGEKIEPAEARVVEFIRRLTRTKLINLFEKKG
ncbi:MAG: PqqD family protein [Chlorobi bacterium]|nr:PqqD family protein [Chlorobiota bacterium]